jgi:hypothetical protein
MLKKGSCQIRLITLVLIVLLIQLLSLLRKAHIELTLLGWIGAIHVRGETMMLQNISESLVIG